MCVCVSAYLSVFFLTPLGLCFEKGFRTTETHMSWDIQPNKQSDLTFHAEWGLLFRVGNTGKAGSISQTVRCQCL